MTQPPSRRRTATLADERPATPHSDGRVPVSVLAPSPPDVFEKILAGLRNFLLLIAAFFAGQLAVSPGPIAAFAWFATVALAVLAHQRRARMAADRRNRPRVTPLVDLLPAVDVPCGIYGKVDFPALRDRYQLGNDVGIWSVRPGFTWRYDLWFRPVDRR
jgi:hypothetical protein